MPTHGAFMGQLKPLLDRFGNHSDFTLMLFTLDETTYCARTGAAGRALSLPEAGAGLVVP